MDNLGDIDLLTTPVDAGLGVFIDLEKADFIGKSALLEGNRQTRILGIKCETATPMHGAKIVDGQACVGRLTATSWSPYLECGIGYVRFHQTGDWVGRHLHMKTEQDRLASCEIVPLPIMMVINAFLETCIRAITEVKALSGLANPVITSTEPLRVF